MGIHPAERRQGRHQHDRFIAVFQVVERELADDDWMRRASEKGTLTFWPSNTTPVLGTAFGINSLRKR